MSVDRAVVPAPPGTVFTVLSDPRTYDEFVVGTRRIRRFDPTWPAVGAAFDHTLGVGPLVVRDQTSVVEVEQDRRLVLRACMGPLAVNRVTLTLRPTPGGTEVGIEERAVERPLSKVWNPVLDALMSMRNRLLLRRLGRVAARRLGQQSAASPR